MIVICLTAAAATGGAQTIEPPHITIPRVSGTPHRSDFESMERLDGPLGMRRIEGFLQRFPNDGEPVSERTIVYVGYDAEFLYVAFQCFDAEAARIGAHMVTRDAFPNDEDTVAVHIDTFRDLKHAYGFQVNAYGLQTDGTYTEGQGWDRSTTRHRPVRHPLWRGARGSVSPASSGTSAAILRRRFHQQPR